MAIELVRQLESLGYKGNLILIDSSPELIKRFAQLDYSDTFDNVAQVNIILKLLDYIGAGKVKTEVSYCFLIYKSLFYFIFYILLIIYIITIYTYYYVYMALIYLN